MEPATRSGTLRQEVLATYQDKETEPLPMSGQKEFQHLKTIIIKNAMEHTHHVPPSMVAEPVDTSPIGLYTKFYALPKNAGNFMLHN